MTASQDLLSQARASMDKTLQHLQGILRSVRTARASPALVDQIKVEYYGTLTPIAQMAAISIPEPRQIVIKPFDVSAMKEIEKGIMKSDLGITPQNDGKVLRLQMPPLSGEQRKKYAAKVKEMAEEGRIALRNGRRDFNKKADQLEKDGLITEDDNRRLHEKIQDLLKEYEKKVDEITDRKVTEITEV